MGGKAKDNVKKINFMDYETWKFNAALQGFSDNPYSESNQYNSSY